MIVVQINETCTRGSTGHICRAVSELLDKQGIENYILHVQKNCDHPNGIVYARRFYIKVQALLSRIFGLYGFNSRIATKRLIRDLERIRPTVVHMHNLHGHNCHLGLLFSYLREKGIRIFWTFHDCWAFTGYCPHFDMIGCDRWQTECHHCPQMGDFSWFFDRSRKLHRLKKEISRGLDLTVVAPSRWMGEMAKRSFFGIYPIRVIHNGIDTDVFRPTEGKIRETYGIGDKKLVLGVAFDWGRRKGLDVFSDLVRQLDDSYRIVLVGTDRQVDPYLPEGVISVHRTADQSELARFYTAADVFVNPTREEVLGLVNLEALACGTPVITFRSGGSPECVDETCGIVVPKDDVVTLAEAIRFVASEKPFSQEACRAYALRFNAKERFNDYIQLYELSHE